jgi:hypothetical protein
MSLDHNAEDRTLDRQLVHLGPPDDAVPLFRGILGSRCRYPGGSPVSGRGRVVSEKPDPAKSFTYGRGARGPPWMKGSNPARTELVEGVVSADEDKFRVGAGLAPRSEEVAAENINIVCGGRLARRLQAGGEFWSAQAISGVPMQFPTGEFGGNLVGSTSSVGNSGFLVVGDGRANVAQPGSAGSWCRPPPTLFFKTSPLARIVFWVPIAVLVTAAAGVDLEPRSEDAAPVIPQYARNCRSRRWPRGRRRSGTPCGILQQGLPSKRSRTKNEMLDDMRCTGRRTARPHRGREQ